MAEPLKNLYSRAYFDDLCAAISGVYPPFAADIFYARLFDEAWGERALKERMRHVAQVMRQVLPAEYRAALAVLHEAAPHLRQYTFQNIFMPDFVALYGLEDWEASLPALEWFTRFSSAEFAVRPFIVQDTPRMMGQMLAWAAHTNDHVRRLASEGCRPRLPWGMALAAFKRDPTPILPILETLRDDPSEYVRRSVANNLNDIAKNHPALIVALLERWNADATPERRWIIRHALRTLVKSGHTDSLALLGYTDSIQVRVDSFGVDAPSVPLGGTLRFAVTLTSLAEGEQALMIDYAVHYRKANGSLSPKVFKLSKITLQPGETRTLQRRISFRPITTRVYYPGEHRLSLQINGQMFAGPAFMLLG